jgi:hypothetical protein
MSSPYWQRLCMGFAEFVLMGTRELTKILS